MKELGERMRKKSHISLARYMVESLNDEDLKKHKFSFYLGSILPDIKPSFLYKRHEISRTFPAVRRHIERLAEGQKTIEKKGRKYYMDLGQISHYLADYFTFPHNKSYPGGLKDHCSYEEKLKKDLRRYIKSGEAARNHAVMQLTGQIPGRHAAVTMGEEHFRNAESLCNFIQKTHEDYIGRKHDVEDDIHHIVEVNQKALSGMMALLAERRAEWAFKHS